VTQHAAEVTPGLPRLHPIDIDIDEPDLHDESLFSFVIVCRISNRH